MPPLLLVLEYNSVMPTINRRAAIVYERVWAWFLSIVNSPYVTWWLGLASFLDGFISPIMPEILVSGLVLAHPTRWRVYVAWAAIGSIFGSIVGFLLGGVLYYYFGAPLIHFLHLEQAFIVAQEALSERVFITMLIVPAFWLMPEKVFTYAAGFLGVPFFPFIAGFAIGRTLRIALVGYLVSRHGRKALDTIKKHGIRTSVAVLILAVIYGIVRVCLH